MQGHPAICCEIHLDLEWRSRLGAAADCIDPEDSSSGDPMAGPRVAEALGPDRDQRRPGGEDFERVIATRDPPMPTIGSSPPRRQRGPGPPRSAASPARRAPPGLPRCPGCAVAGSIALAFIVLINETASAPPSSAATATAAGSATFGVSFTISGFAVSGRSASSSAAVSSGCSPTISPEWTLGRRRSARPPQPHPAPPAPRPSA